MNIMITGGSGQVGFELKRQFAPFGAVYAPTRRQLDLSDADAVDAYLRRVAPGLIINAGAYTSVDGAEKEPGLALELNARLPAQLAVYATAHRAQLIHYSTDYVYSGEGTLPWHEGSEANPLSVYGRTKLEGDQAVMNSGGSYLILRTSWVYAARGKNFMNTMLRLGQQRKTLSIVNDQFGAPTPARLIAEVTMLAVERCIPSGLYHLAADGETSWYGFANEIFRMAEEMRSPFSTTYRTSVGIPTDEYPTPATRPLNSRLDATKLEQALGIALPEWKQQLMLTLEERLAYMDNSAF